MSNRTPRRGGHRQRVEQTMAEGLRELASDPAILALDPVPSVHVYDGWVDEDHRGAEVWAVDSTDRDEWRAGLDAAADWLLAQPTHRQQALAVLVEPR